MVSLTLSVPKELKKEMEEHKEINWSHVAREAIQNKIIMLNKFKEFTKQSSFNEEDAIKLGRKIKK